MTDTNKELFSISLNSPLQITHNGKYVFYSYSNNGIVKQLNMEPKLADYFTERYKNGLSAHSNEGYKEDKRVLAEY